jgi:hypothetical protein
VGSERNRSCGDVLKVLAIAGVRAFQVDSGCCQRL